MSKKSTVIFVPTLAEARPFVSVLGKVEPVKQNWGLQFICTDSLSIAVCGVGQKAVKRAYESFPGMGGFKRLILSGVAGGLKEEAGIGEMYYVDRVSKLTGRENDFKQEGARDFLVFREPALINDYRSFCEVSGINFNRAAMVTCDSFVNGLAKRERISSLTGALLVDMEAYQLAEMSKGDSKDFICFKTVSDNPYSELNLDFSKVMTSHGDFDENKIVKYLAAEPSKIFQLIQFRKNLKKCEAVLFELAHFLMKAC
jgi:nucleoside phosphorylase